MLNYVINMIIDGNYSTCNTNPEIRQNIKLDNMIDNLSLGTAITQDYNRRGEKNYLTMISEN